MLKISSVRHRYPEKAPFRIQRDKGHRNYTFLHFHSRVNLVLSGKVIETDPHAVILISPDVPQLFWCEEDLIHDWFHFSGDFDALPLSVFRPDTLYYPAESLGIPRAVARLETEFFGGDGASEVLIDCLMKTFFIDLDRSLSGKRPALSIPHEGKLRTLRRQLLSPQNEDKSVEELAAQADLSPSRFYALYRSLYGTSPHADRILARINSAKNRLGMGKESISVIAEELGYENTTHFIRQFKAHTGLSPSAFRKMKGSVEKDTIL